MTPRNTAILAAALAFVAAPGPARAINSVPCKGNAYIEAIYQRQIGDHLYEYTATIKLIAAYNLTMNVTFLNFPSTVTLYSRTPNITLTSAGATIKFGKGSYDKVSGTDVARVYDFAAGPGPTVRLGACIKA